MYIYMNVRHAMDGKEAYIYKSLLMYHIYAPYIYTINDRHLTDLIPARTVPNQTTTGGGLADAHNIHSFSREQH